MSQQELSRYDRLQSELLQAPRKWLITGVAGFIGSNLLEKLLQLDQQVVGLDNFATGRQRNLEEVKTLVSGHQWARFRFDHGDILNQEDCRRACEGVDYVLHQAALGSVPRSIADPIATNAANITGFLNIAVAARDAGTKRFVYAASSSTYGDHADLPKVEETIGRPLSPYAVTKYVNELYADVMARCYGFETIGLRYFNVFGPRQDPEGAYAAVIPKWTARLINGEDVFINGDGETSRDFCFVSNAVQANLLAATTISSNVVNEVYNVALGQRTTLNELYAKLRSLLAEGRPHLAQAKPIYRDFRAGDVRHSQADVHKAQQRLGYAPTENVSDGLDITVPWFVSAWRKPGHVAEGRNADGMH